MISSTTVPSREFTEGRGLRGSQGRALNPMSTSFFAEMFLLPAEGAAPFLLLTSRSLWSTPPSGLCRTGDSLWAVSGFDTWVPGGVPLFLPFPLKGTSQVQAPAIPTHPPLCCHISLESLHLPGPEIQPRLILFSPKFSTMTFPQGKQVGKQERKKKNNPKIQ